jgi:hypothetical protein
MLSRLAQPTTSAHGKRVDGDAHITDVPRAARRPF